MRHSHCRTPSLAASEYDRKVCVSFSLYLALKQQTRHSHFHSFKSSSACAAPNITRRTHLHRAAFSCCSQIKLLVSNTAVTLIKDYSSGLKPQFRAYMSLCPSLSVRASDGQGLSVGLEAPEHCAAGDLLNHAEVCCSHHSSAIMNSADH